MKLIHFLIGALSAAVVLSVFGLSLEKSAEAAGAVYVRRDNPVDRQTHQFVTITPVDAGADAFPNQSALLGTGVATFDYPGRCGYSHDQYLMCWRDGGTPRYWRLAYANPSAPSATPEWDYTTTGNFLSPSRGATANVSIGQVVVPQAGAKFEVIGNVFLDGALTVNDAEADLDTRIAASGATNALFVQGSDGNVGIGTASPGAPLDIETTGDVWIELTSTGVGGTTWALQQTVSSGTDGRFGLNEGGSEHFTVLKTSGFVGMGTAAPGYDLHVERSRDPGPTEIRVENTESTKGSSNSRLTAETNNANASPALQLINTTATWTVGIDGTAVTGLSALKFGDSASPGTAAIMTMLVGGDVGIGTEAPDTLLHVMESSAGAVTAVAGSVLTVERTTDAFISILSGATNYGELLFGSTVSNSRGGILYNHNTDKLVFRQWDLSRWAISGANGDLVAEADEILGFGTQTDPDPVTVGNGYAYYNTTSACLKVYTGAGYECLATVGGGGGGSAEWVHNTTFIRPIRGTGEGVSIARTGAPDAGYSLHIGNLTDDAGYVRIEGQDGHTTPQAHLSLMGGTSGGANLDLYTWTIGGINLATIVGDGDTDLKLGVLNGPQFWFDNATGFVGLSDSGALQSPDTFLEISQTSVNAFTGLKVTNATNNAAVATSAALNLAYTATAGESVASIRVQEDAIDSSSGDIIFAVPIAGVTTDAVWFISNGATSNVGIGTGAPTSKLAVMGTTSIGSAGPNASAAESASISILRDSGSTITRPLLVLQSQNSGSVDGDSFITYGTQANNWSAGVDQADSGKFRIEPSATLGGVSGLTITSTGLVGIGTVAPATLLHVGLAGSTTGVVTLAGSTSDEITIQPPAAAGGWVWTLPADDGAANYTMHTNGSGVSSWSLVDLTTDLTGILPTANGGMGADMTAAGAGELAVSTGALTWGTVGAGNVNELMTSGGAANPTWESNLTFTGSLLTVTGTATFTSGATASTATINSTDATVYNAAAFQATSRLTLLGGNGVGAHNLIRFTSAGTHEGFFGTVQNASGEADFIFKTYNGAYAERVRIDSDGNVGIGTTAPTVNLEIAEAGATALPTLMISNYSTGTAFSSVLQFRKSASNTLGVLAETIDNDVLGRIDWYGADSTPDAVASGRIDVTQDGAATATGVPTEMIFSTNTGTGLTQRMVILPSGNVGVGTAAPTNLLHISAPSQVAAFVPDTESTWATVQIFAAAGVDQAARGIKFGDNGTNKAAGIVSVSNLTGGGRAELAFITAVTNVSYERVRIDEDGNVGIGTVAPANKLQVYTGANGNIALFEGSGYSVTLGADATGAYIYQNSAARNFSFGSNSSRIDVTIDADGDVGMGTATPGYDLHVSKSNDFSVSGRHTEIRAYNTESTKGASGARLTARTSSASSDPALQLINPGGTWTVGIDGTDSKLKIGDAATVGSGTIMTLEPAGDVGIGTEDPTVRLHVFSTGTPTVFVENGTVDPKIKIGEAAGASKFGVLGWDTTSDFTYLDSDGSTALLLQSNQEGVGNVGIGAITVPDSMLHVYKASAGQTATGDTLLTLEHSGNVYLSILTGTTGIGGLAFGDSGAAHIGGISYLHSGNKFLFYTDSVSTVEMNSSIAEMWVYQNISSAAKPVMYLNQSDIDDTFINYQGTSSAGTTRSISTLSAGAKSDVGTVAAPYEADWTFQGMVRIEVNGSLFWMPYYSVK